MAVQNTYADLNSRQQARVDARLLVRALPYLNIERFGQTREQPMNETNSVIFRRYESLGLSKTPLTEGVTPTGQKLTFTDVPATLEQYGGWVPFTDVLLDMHEDPIPSETTTLLGEQAGQTIESIYWDILVGGTNVVRNNGSQRSDINTVPSLSALRTSTRLLKRQNARRHTDVVSSSPNFGTQSLPDSWIALMHPDLENDIRNIPGFKHRADYGSSQVAIARNEFGAVDEVRFLTSTLYEPFADAGGTAATNSTISTTGTNSDVYPILILGQHAYGTIPLRGKRSLRATMVRPRPAPGDPLGQRGSAGWKTYRTAVILNDLFMVRWEVAASV